MVWCPLPRTTPPSPKKKVAKVRNGFSEDNDQWSVLPGTRGKTCPNRGAGGAERMPVWLEPSESAGWRDQKKVQRWEGAMMKSFVFTQKCSGEPKRGRNQGSAVT